MNKNIFINTSEKILQNNQKSGTIIKSHIKTHKKEDFTNITDWLCGKTNSSIDEILNCHN